MVYNYKGGTKRNMGQCGRRHILWFCISHLIGRRYTILEKLVSCSSHSTYQSRKLQESPSLDNHRPSQMSSIQWGCYGSTYSRNKRIGRQTRWSRGQTFKSSYSFEACQLQGRQFTIALLDSILYQFCMMIQTHSGDIVAI